MLGVRNIIWDPDEDPVWDYTSYRYNISKPLHSSPKEGRAEEQTEKQKLIGESKQKQKSISRRICPFFI